MQQRLQLQNAGRRTPPECIQGATEEAANKTVNTTLHHLVDFDYVQFT